MFFACGAWVLYMQIIHIVDNPKNKWFTFFAHFCLCQVHYLGIIFSGLSGTVYFLTSIKKGSWGRIPIPIVLCWLASILLYLIYLTNQKSVLNTWPKPNEISDLLAGYNDSILILTILIPIYTIILTKKSNGNTKPSLTRETHFLRPIFITSILWFSVPIFVWILSHLTSLNLFVDRYFIPKESALIFLVAYGFNFISRKLPQQKTLHVPILGALSLSILLFLISTKRTLFGLNNDTNYHHSLIVEESYPRSNQPLILEGDPKYFPNAYLGKNKCLFDLRNDRLIEVYQRFSSKIKFLKK